MLGFPTNPTARYRSPNDVETALLEQRVKVLEHALAAHVERFGHTVLSRRVLPDYEPVDGGGAQEVADS